MLLGDIGDTDIHKQHNRHDGDQSLSSHDKVRVHRSQQLQQKYLVISLEPLLTIQHTSFNVPLVYQDTAKDKVEMNFISKNSQKSFHCRKNRVNTSMLLFCQPHKVISRQMTHFEKQTFGL